MKESVLKEFRSEYKRKLEEKERFDKGLSVLLKRRELLENSPIVRDYIELSNKIAELTNESCSIEDVFLDTLYDMENKGLTDETNNIFLYEATFVNENRSETIVDRDSSLAEFDRYINIESLEHVDIPVEDRAVFEQNNKILILDTDEPIKYISYDVRDQFFKDALLYGQETACKKVLSRNKKN